MKGSDGRSSSNGKTSGRIFLNIANHVIAPCPVVQHVIYSKGFSPTSRKAGMACSCARPTLPISSQETEREISIASE